MQATMSAANGQSRGRVVALAADQAVDEQLWVERAQEADTSARPPLSDLSGSGRLGQRMAAEIVGPLLPLEQRPGPVEFLGPTEFSEESGDV